MILISGVPRSGTTWVGRVLGYAENVRLCHEPDNEHGNLLAYLNKQQLARFPYLRKEDPRDHGLYRIYNDVINGKPISGYERSSNIVKRLLQLREETVEEQLQKKQRFFRNYGTDQTPWPYETSARLKLIQLLLEVIWLSEQFASSRKLVVKSVHSILALPYLQHHFNPQVVLVVRHPADIVLSHTKLKNPDINRDIFAHKRFQEDYLSGSLMQEVKKLSTPLEKAGAQVGAFYYIFARQFKDHPDWILVEHETYCMDPVEQFKTLYNQLNLRWSSEIEKFIRELNSSEQSGYEARRIAQNQTGKWKKELSADEAEQIRRGYSLFPHHFYRDFATEPRKRAV